MNTAHHVVQCLIDGRRYAIPLAAVDRVIRAVEIAPLPNASQDVLGAINMHGRIVCVVNLRRRLGLKEREPDVDDQFVIARIGTRTVALPADAVEIVECSDSAFGCAEPSLMEQGTRQDMVKREDGLVMICDLDALFCDQNQFSHDVSGVNSGSKA